MNITIIKNGFGELELVSTEKDYIDYVKEKEEYYHCIISKKGAKIIVNPESLYMAIEAITNDFRFYNMVDVTFSWR